jgi:hypothetical protein
MEGLEARFKGLREKGKELRKENVGGLAKAAVPPVTFAAMKEDNRFWNWMKDVSYFLAFSRHLEFLFWELTTIHVVTS